MNSQSPTPSAADRIIVRGIHLELTDSLRTIAQEKGAKLFRHQDAIIRLRIDLESDQTKDTTQRYVARGLIEIGGPDLVASVSSEDAYKSIDLLVDKLDSLLRQRASRFKERRHHTEALDNLST